MSRCRKCNRPKRRFDRWSLRYKGFELAQIECLGFFKLTNMRNEPCDVELWPMNAHAAKVVQRASTENDV